jgi:hypothetical protein
VRPTQKKVRGPGCGDEAAVFACDAAILWPSRSPYPSTVPMFAAFLRVGDH